MLIEVIFLHSIKLYLPTAISPEINRPLKSLTSVLAQCMY